jgi:hypothetical protein
MFDIRSVLKQSTDPICIKCNISKSASRNRKMLIEIIQVQEILAIKTEISS